MVEYDIPFVCLIFTLCVNSTNLISHYLISIDNSIYAKYICNY